jgi:hypothetical protein
MSSRRPPFRTVYIPDYLDYDTQQILYDTILEAFEGQWVDGPKSSRLASPQPLDAIPEIMHIIGEVVRDYLPEGTMVSYGCYYNFYKDGMMYTPTHSHPDTIQIILSLGPGIRTLKVGKKEYIQSPGALTIFGTSAHGVAREPEVTEGRIGVAIFCRRS